MVSPRCRPGTNGTIEKKIRKAPFNLFAFPIIDAIPFSLPQYSPELNPMEQLWQQLSKLKLSNTCYENYENNVKKLCSRDWAIIES